MVRLLVGDVFLHFLRAEELYEATELLLVELALTISVEQFEVVKKQLVDLLSIELFLDTINKILQIRNFAVQIRDFKAFVQLLTC